MSTMLGVVGSVAIRPDAVARVSSAAIDFVRACREEDGCVDYALSWAVDAENELRLTELWASEEAHAAHRAQPHVSAWAALVTDAAAGPPKFTKISQCGNENG